MQVPPRLESLDLTHFDGGRPDGMNIMPREKERLLVWDGTWPDTLASLYRAHATVMQGLWQHWQRKINYRSFEAQCFSCAHWVSGGIWTRHWSFWRILGQRIRQRTRKDRACKYLLQQLSVAVQRGNTVLVMGWVGAISYDSIVGILVSNLNSIFLLVLLLLGHFTVWFHLYFLLWVCSAFISL